MNLSRPTRVIFALVLALLPFFSFAALSVVAANDRGPSSASAEMPSAASAAVLQDRPHLPVWHKTASEPAVSSNESTANAPSSIPPAGQAITGTEDTLFLVDSRQFGRTDNFSAGSPTWGITTTFPFIAYDFILDPQDPYRTAWIATDNGIWRMTNLNSSSAITWTQIRSMAQITAELSTQRITVTPPFLGVSRIVADVSRPGYFFVVLASAAGQVPSGVVGWTSNSGGAWSWKQLPPAPVGNGLGTKTNPTSLALSRMVQDVSGSVLMVRLTSLSLMLYILLITGRPGRSFGIVTTHPC